MTGKAELVKVEPGVFAKYSLTDGTGEYHLPTATRPRVLMTRSTSSPTSSRSPWVATTPVSRRSRFCGSHDCAGKLENAIGSNGFYDDTAEQWEEVSEEDCANPVDDNTKLICALKSHETNAPN